VDEEKDMKLNAKMRNALPKKEFALPGGRFPIPDESHGRAALSMAHNASPAEQQTIKSKVASKFPDIQQSPGKKMMSRKIMKKGW
jgi:hypothetical protein